MGALTSDTWSALNVWTTTATTDTLTISANDWGNYGTISYENPQFKPPKPATNLDWLDERINEMRVKL